MLEADLRLDAEYHLSDGRKTRKLIQKSPYKVENLKAFSDRIFYGGRSSRKYVTDKNRGIPFIGSKDMLRSDVSPKKYISKTKTNDLSSYLLDLNWILVSRSGTVGNTVFTNKDFLNKGASEHIIRIVPNDKIEPEYLYAYLSTKYGYALMTQGTFGGVIRHIEPDFLAEVPVPKLPSKQRAKISLIISESYQKKAKSNEILREANNIFFSHTRLRNLSNSDYEFFAHHDFKRPPSVFEVSSEQISSVTLHAFNHSRKIATLTKYIKGNNETKPLIECLDESQFFSTGSFPRLELNSPKSIRLINQTDIFNSKIKGKNIARKKVRVDNLVKYGEVLIAAVGTLGENETFGRALFANEELNGQLVSGEFIRMRTNRDIPPGYLFTWLNSDYGFRLIRSTQTGTKLCRPIQQLLGQLPVPVLSKELMDKIDHLVKKAHSLKWESVLLEREGIHVIENEIESWQK